MIIGFSTDSGSVYELDTDRYQIRRCGGTHAPTPRQGDDGVWRDIWDVEMWDGGLLIHWNEYGQGTLTSHLVEVWGREEVASDHGI